MDHKAHNQSTDSSLLPVTTRRSFTSSGRSKQPGELGTYAQGQEDGPGQCSGALNRKPNYLSISVQPN